LTAPGMWPLRIHVRPWPLYAGSGRASTNDVPGRDRRRRTAAVSTLVSGLRPAVNRAFPGAG
jgi:hypothetical protein